MSETVFTSTLLEKWQLALVQYPPWKQEPLKVSFTRARKESKNSRVSGVTMKVAPPNCIPFTF